MSQGTQSHETRSTALTNQHSVSGNVGQGHGSLGSPEMTQAKHRKGAGQTDAAKSNQNQKPFFDPKRIFQSNVGSERAAHPGSKPGSKTRVEDKSSIPNNQQPRDNPEVGIYIVG